MKGKEGGAGVLEPKPGTEAEASAAEPAAQAEKLEAEPALVGDLAGEAKDVEAEKLQVGLEQISDLIDGLPDSKAPVSAPKASSAGASDGAQAAALRSSLKTLAPSTRTASLDSIRETAMRIYPDGKGGLTPEEIKLKREAYIRTVAGASPETKKQLETGKSPEVGLDSIRQTAMRIYPDGKEGLTPKEIEAKREMYIRRVSGAFAEEAKRLAGKGEKADEVTLAGSETVGATAAAAEDLKEETGPEPGLAAVEAGAKTLQERRGEYIAAYHAHLDARKNKSVFSKVGAFLFGMKPEAEDKLPAELREKKAAYDDARRAEAGALFSSKKKALEAGTVTPEDLAFLREKFSERYDKVHAEKLIAEAEAGKIDPNYVEELLSRYKSTEILNGLVAERDNLEAAKAELWTPERRGLFRRSIEAYAKMPLPARIAVSAGILALPSVAVGAWGAVAVTAGTVAARSLVSIGTGMVTGVAFEKVLPREKYAGNAEYAKALEELRRDYGQGADFMDIDAKLGESREERNKRQRRYLLAKGLTMVAAGSLAGAGFRMYQEGTLGSKSWKLAFGGPDTPPQPIPERVVVPEAAVPAAEAAASPSGATAQAVEAGTIVNAEAAPAGPTEGGDLGARDFDVEPPVEVYNPMEHLQVKITPETDNIWSAVESVMKPLAAQQGWNEGQLTVATDTIYQKIVAMSPSELKGIGISSGNIHKIAEGSVLQLDKVVTEGVLEKAVKNGNGLSAQLAEHIQANNKLIRAYHQVNPKVPITEYLVNNRILK